MEEHDDRSANITMEEREVVRDEICAGGDSATEGLLEIVEETSETQCDEGVVGDVAVPSASVQLSMDLNQFGKLLVSARLIRTTVLMTIVVKVQVLLP